MTSTNTNISNSIRIRTRVVQLQHANRQTANSTSLDQLIDSAIRREALQRIQFHGLDSRGVSVITAAIRVTYQNGVASFDLLTSSSQPDFLMGSGDSPILGPQIDEPYCEMWKAVLDDFMRICKALDFKLDWDVSLSGLHAQEIRDEFRLSSSDIRSEATQTVGDQLPNTYDSGLSLQLSVSKDIAEREMPR